MICRRYAATLATLALLVSVSVQPGMPQPLEAQSASAASPGKSGPSKSDPTKAAGLTLSVSTNKKTYAVDEPIKLVLTAHNNSKADIRLTFNSGKRFDFAIRHGETTDWVWSKGMMFAMMVTMETLKAGATQTYTATYDAKASHGRLLPLSPGAYNVTGTLTISAPVASPTGTMEFHIK